MKNISKVLLAITLVISLIISNLTVSNAQSLPSLYYWVETKYATYGGKDGSIAGNDKNDIGIKTFSAKSYDFNGDIYYSVIGYLNGIPFADGKNGTKASIYTAIRRITIKLKPSSPYSIKYRVCSLNNEWSDWFYDGAEANIKDQKIKLIQAKIIFKPEYMNYPYKRYYDITGDGKRDLIAINDRHCYVVPGVDGGYDYDSRQYLYSEYFRYPYKNFADINADGKVDYIGINNTHCYVVPGAKFGFNNNARKYDNRTYFSYPNKQIYDFNNDGYMDFIGTSGQHRYKVPGNSNCQFDYNKRIYEKLW